MVSHGTVLVTFWMKPCRMQREEGPKKMVMTMTLALKVSVVTCQACCTATSCPMKRRRRSRYWLYNSMSLCPAPSTQRGSTALGQRSNRARPWEKSITSSSVPWMMSTGDGILDTFSMLEEEKVKIKRKGSNIKNWFIWFITPIRYLKEDFFPR